MTWPRWAFLSTRFQKTSVALIDIANQIIDDYATQGIFELSLRQVYYRFVARNVIANTYNSYRVSAG